jgi:hypothetical protein
MKYVLLFCGSQADQQAFDSLKPEALSKRYAEVGAWFGANRDRIVNSNQLQGPETATSVRFDQGGNASVKDGLFLEAKELVGGYAEVEVDDLDEALAMAKAWPGRGTVEVRPVVERR